MFIKQDPMRRVVYSLVPIFLWSVYLYGWRVVALLAFVYLLGIMAEFLFEKSRNKKVTEAVLVTCALYGLSLPPAVPFWAAGVGIIFAVIVGKEVWGGFGRNPFNPAITGRTFVYIAFPLMLQTTWMIPGDFGTKAVNILIRGSTWLDAVFMILLAAALFWYVQKNVGKTRNLIIGFATAIVLTIGFYLFVTYGFPYSKTHQTSLSELDAISMATPLEVYKGLAQQNNWHYSLTLFGATAGDLSQNSPLMMFFGFRTGAIGESSIFLIIAAGIYLLWTKTANWRPLMWTILSGALLTVIFYYTGVLSSRFPLLAVKADVAGQLSDIFGFLMAGSLLYAAIFMSTDPVSAPKKPLSQHVYGFIIGGLTITIRVFAGFPEGVSFAILTANTFASLLDEIMPAKKKKAAAGQKAVAEGAAT